MSYLDSGIETTGMGHIDASVNANFNEISAAIAKARIKEKARIEAEARIKEKKNAVLAVLEDGPPPNKRKC